MESKLYLYTVAVFLLLKSEKVQIVEQYIQFFL